ncbi:MAG: ribbon-helix-helix protein, CopG family [Rhodocyclaceae bacterium]|nr:ribbon-helix-helix protein, CopG family [Rhodocyclaceae bacterium]
MNTLTIKVPPQLETAIIEASAREHLSKSALVRRALESYLRQRKTGDSFVSALDRAGDLVGCFAGGPADLASNPKHLADFGRV